MGAKRVRRGWRREGDGLDARYHHIESRWVILHCGHPTANYPYYGLEPGRTEAFTSGGFGKGYAFHHIQTAQERVEHYLERTAKMGWQERIKQKTMDEAVAWLLSDAIVEGELLDNHLYEHVFNPWKERDQDVVRLHRLWGAKKRADGEELTFCVDIHEYDDPKEPYFANKIMSISEGPWGLQPPKNFGKRKGGNKPRKAKRMTVGSEETIGESMARRKEEAKKKPVATRKKKKPGKRLDKKTHKMVASKKAACGKPIGEMDAGIWSGGVEGRDTWHWVDCKECLAVMPEVVHSVNFQAAAGLYGCMEVYDDTDGARWKAPTACGKKGSPLETSTDESASVNCIDCLSTIAPMYRRHFIKEGGSPKSTKCGAKTNSGNEYSTDCWWLCTCPDCYRINEAPAVHPMQEEDVQLLLHNSMVAARNQGMKPTQEKCVSCSVDSMRAKTKCLACAVLTKRGISTDDEWENKLAKLFNLPYEWVMDLLKGWDGDKGPELTYPTAYKLGKRLWRKHG